MCIRDRPGSIGEPLYLDVLAAINGTQFATCPVYTGRYGLGSKDTKPSDILACLLYTSRCV